MNNTPDTPRTDAPTLHGMINHQKWCDKCGGFVEGIFAGNPRSCRCDPKSDRIKKLESEVERLRGIVAQLIHYPECWDTACYETMDDAIHEIDNFRDCFDCQCDECEFNNPTDK